MEILLAVVLVLVLVYHADMLEAGMVGIIDAYRRLWDGFAGVWRTATPGPPRQGGSMTGNDFGWTFIMDVPNPVGEDFHLWACDLCGAVVPDTHERVHLKSHDIKIPFTITGGEEEA